MCVYVFVCSRHIFISILVCVYVCIIYIMLKEQLRPKMELLMLSPMLTNQNLTKFLCSAFRKRRPRSTSQCLPAQHKLPNQAPRLIFAFHVWKKPCCNQSTDACMTSLFFFPSACKSLSFCKVPQNSFLSVRLDASCFMNH